MSKRQKKKRILVVSPPPSLRAGKLYRGSIKQISDINKKTGTFTATIENLDPSQAGRIHEVHLPESLFPGSKKLGNQATGDRSESGSISGGGIGEESGAQRGNNRSFSCGGTNRADGTDRDNK